MEERDFFHETRETKPFHANCPHCHKSATYTIAWYRRVKKAALPRGADPEDVRRFQNARSYMVRAEDQIACSNPECRKRFDVVGLQTVVFLEGADALGGPASDRGGGQPAGPDRSGRPPRPYPAGRPPRRR